MFKINGTEFPRPDRIVRGTIENITTEGGRQSGVASGAITRITTVNVASTFTYEWRSLTGHEMIKLCNIFRIIQPNWRDNEFSGFQQRTESEPDGLSRVVELETILPVGIRKIEVYVGDSFRFQLENLSGFNELKPSDFIEGGKYLDFIRWTNVQIDVVGIGQVPTMNANHDVIATWR